MSKLKLADLRVPDSDDKNEFLKNARKVWAESHQDRRSDRKIIMNAIREIDQANAAWGKTWTQAEWIRRVHEIIDYRHADATKGRATIKKYLKEYLGRGVRVLNHMPASIIMTKPVEMQLDEWFVNALAEAAAASLSAGSTRFTINFELANVTHRALCLKNIPKSLRPSEAKRQAWFTRQWNTTSQVPVKSRKSTI